MAVKTTPKVELGGLAQVDTAAAVRAVLQEGRATVLVANRKTDRDALDVRKRADAKGTVRHAVNRLAADQGTTPYAVAQGLGIELNFHATREGAWAITKDELSLAPARGGLRAAWLATVAG